MKRRIALLVAALAATLATDAAAQAAALDSTQAVYRDTLLGLRDAVTSLRGQVGRFRRDLQLVGGPTVVGRAERLHGACEDLRSRVENSRDMFRSTRVPQAARDAASTMVRQIGELHRALRTHCTEGLAPTGPGVRADSLKAWGPYHTSQLEQHFAAYGQSAAALAKAMGFRLEPRRP